MKLKRHREDVKYIKRRFWDDSMNEIAQRYLNLIRMAEEAFKMNSGYYGITFPDEGTIKEKRVLKDAGE